MVADIGDFIDSEERLREVYEQPSRGALTKVIDHVDRHCRDFIARSPFLCIGTTGADGIGDVSPRGDAPGFVQVLDDKHLAIPDRPGNNRLDTLTNIVRRGEVGLLFFIPGFEDTLRVNGSARLTTDAALLQRFVVRDRTPRAVVLVQVRQAYTHCAKSIKRAELWNPERHADRRTFPSLGEMLRDHLAITAQMPQTYDVATIDAHVEKDARERLY